MDALSRVIIAKALDGLTARAEATAVNIANANSPGYRPLRVAFEEQLRTAAQAAARAGTRTIADVVPRTDLAEVPRFVTEMRLDLELATAAQTAMRYAALIDILGRQMAIGRAVVAGGR